MDDVGDKEDVLANKFFQILQSAFEPLYALAQKNCWLICVPCSWSLSGMRITPEFVGAQRFDVERFLRFLDSLRLLPPPPPISAIYPSKDIRNRCCIYSILCCFHCAMLCRFHRASSSRPSSGLIALPTSHYDLVETHILKPSPLFQGLFEVFNNDRKTCEIEAKVITTTRGFPKVRKSRILSEELFYNKECASWSIGRC